MMLIYVHQLPGRAGQALTRICTRLRPNPHWLHIQLPLVGLSSLDAHLSLWPPTGSHV